MKFFLVFVLSILVTLIYADEENCDYKGNLIYEDLGCKPVNEEGHACPVKYVCNFEVKNNTCTFKGRNVPLFEKLSNDDIYGACILDCYCSKTNTFECAALDCPEWLGNPIKEGCYRKYKAGECCSVGINCPTESSPPKECKINGVLWVEGEIYFPKDTCLDCVCDKDYKGKNEPPFCKRKTCAAEVHDSEKIHKYCAPVYSGSEERVLCCPDSWVCPSKTDKSLPPNSKTYKTSDLTCKYGEKTLNLGERIQSSYTWYDDSVKQANCECITPPLLTCREFSRSYSSSTSTTTQKAEE